MAKECSNSSCSKESCEGCPSKAGQGKPDFHIDLNADSSIKHVIGVVSGKGGVGKSMVTASLANQKAKEGYKVGILDADITGPYIPKMYGLKGRLPGSCSKRRKGNVHQPPASGRGRAGHLERTCHRRNRKTVLDRRHLGRPGLSLRRYAARNR